MPLFTNSKPQLPPGFLLERNNVPSARALNRLLSKCNVDTHPPKELELALKNSFCDLTIWNEGNNELVGFVRITSDMGLNANLWDLVAEPGQNQKKFLTVLVHSALNIIRKEMPGCSVSIAAPKVAIKALLNQGFLLDPTGIRTMAYRIR